MTNYEKIHAMNLEELVEFFDWALDNVAFCTYCKHHNTKKCTEMSCPPIRPFIKKWLNDEAPKE